jgi:hypothetical protein
LYLSKAEQRYSFSHTIKNKRGKKTTSPPALPCREGASPMGCFLANTLNMLLLFPLLLIKGMKQK